MVINPTPSFPAVYPQVNSLLQSLVNLVIVETTRPDLNVESLSAVLASTLKCHLCETFYKDLTSGQIHFKNTLSFYQTLDTRTIPRFRKLAYFRKADTHPSTSNFGNPDCELPPLTGWGYSYYAGRHWKTRLLKVISTDAIFDEYETQKVDVLYQAGSLIQIRSSSQLAWGLFGYYAYPDITFLGYNSWIAREMPFAIVYDATASVLSKIGALDAASQFNTPANPRGEGGGLAVQHLELLKRDNIVVEGQ